MEELRKRAETLHAAVKKAAEQLKLPALEAEHAALLEGMNRPDFWDDSQKAQGESKKASALLARIEPWRSLMNDSRQFVELSKLDDRTMDEDLATLLKQAEAKFDELKKELRYQGPYDDHEAILSIHAGAGGTDAQDWAQMLMRMYVRWAEKQKLDLETVEQTAGEEAGIKSVTLRLGGGPHLYGRLKGEHGVHRLVRLSPFNSDNLRQTSFAKVEILPVIERLDELEIDDKDLKIDVYRAGGHGGQSVNTTDSAVRITHLPTGITVAIQNERSQLQNKETALTILRSRLAQLQVEQHQDKLESIKGPNQSAEWGNQIRSYVLHPYKQVKDNRSGYETSDAEKVLDGELDPLLEAFQEKPYSDA